MCHLWPHCGILHAISDLQVLSSHALHADKLTHLDVTKTAIRDEVCTFALLLCGTTLAMADQLLQHLVCIWLQATLAGCNAPTMHTNTSAVSAWSLW